jgi:hypothetical protein
MNKFELRLAKLIKTVNESITFVIKLKTKEEFVYTLNEIIVYWDKNQQTKNQFYNKCLDLITYHMNEVFSNIKIDKFLNLTIEKRIIETTDIKEIWIDNIILDVNNEHIFYEDNEKYCPNKINLQ